MQQKMHNERDKLIENIEFFRRAIEISNILGEGEEYEAICRRLHTFLLNLPEPLTFSDDHAGVGNYRNGRDRKISLNQIEDWLLYGTYNEYLMLKEERPRPYSGNTGLFHRIRVRERHRKICWNIFELTSNALKEVGATQELYVHTKTNLLARKKGKQLHLCIFISEFRAALLFIISVFVKTILDDCRCGRITDQNVKSETIIFFEDLALPEIKDSCRKFKLNIIDSPSRPIKIYIENMM